MTNQSPEFLTTQVTDIFDSVKGGRGKRDKKHNDVVSRESNTAVTNRQVIGAGYSNVEGTYMM